MVAPVRERGLKSVPKRMHQKTCRRSREGAWIEIDDVDCIITHCCRRSREGAWIEIAPVRCCTLAAVSRSREGAWIEMAVLPPAHALL